MPAAAAPSLLSRHTLACAPPPPPTTPTTHPTQELEALEAAVPAAAVVGERYAGMDHSTYHAKR